MNTILTICQPSRERPAEGQPAHTRQPATTTTPSETPATTLHHPAEHGEEPPILS
ncbi:Hypothetical protein GSB_153957 [Giardia duodenalis]|uniref:Uncharacterized protein n=1 Tax=Giardia intestinalis TaxID=5741 RepID=V6TWB4_GIAIN|nr:Hypothetical protein GSB_153957 [Giardia intestinalis]